MKHELIGEALNIYTFCWLHGTSRDYDHRSALKNENGLTSDDVEIIEKHRQLVETVITRKRICFLEFFAKVIEGSYILREETSCEMALARRIGIRLEKIALNSIFIIHRRFFK